MVWTILARMITLGSSSRGVMSDKCDGTTEDGWVTDVTNESGVLVASRNIIEGHFNASEEGIEGETVVDEVDVEGIEHWVVIDYDLEEEGTEDGWVAYYDIIEGHFNASVEGIEGETVVDEVDVEGIEHWVVIEDGSNVV